jgi:hypothetical protein
LDDISDITAFYDGAVEEAVEPGVATRPASQSTLYKADF